MVFLGAVERTGRLDLGDDRMPPDFGLVHFRDDLPRGLLLLRGMIEDRGSVLGPAVRPLAVEGRRIVHGEEDAQDVDERDRLRVERDLDRLGVARRIRAYGFVGRVRETAAGVSHFDLLHASEFLEDRLEAPEAPARDRRDFTRWIRTCHHVPRPIIRVP